MGIWHFFRNSICFMCFWFGLEILRLVYKKRFFEILNGFYLIWPIILRKKELKENFLEIGRTGYQKKRNFALISKMCRSLKFGKRGKKLLMKNWSFRDLKNFANNPFSGKKFLGTSWRKSATHFFQLLSTPIRDGAVFLKIKAQIG